MSKKLLFGLVITIFGLSGTAVAGPWCDSFGQDWDINFSSGTQGILVVTGCRDCDGSLGCGGLVSLDGALPYDLISGGFVFSTTAYRPPGDTFCVSTHWTGKFVGGILQGTVSNELGPFGDMTISPGPCPAAASGGVDPSVR